MNWTEFLRPSWKKIIFAILLFIPSIFILIYWLIFSRILFNTFFLLLTFTVDYLIACFLFEYYTNSKNKKKTLYWIVAIGILLNLITVVIVSVFWYFATGVY